MSLNREPPAWIRAGLRRVPVASRRVLRHQRRRRAARVPRGARRLGRRRRAHHRHLRGR